MLSDDVRAAAVLSGPLPIIAVAPSVLEHLTADEVDRLVIHEWAHVQRRDDLAHLLQVICRMAAGWHPAVSWLNRRLHEERESACDEMAIALVGSPKAYAASLVKLAALPRVKVTPLPAVGALSSSGLAVRVRRLVSERRLVSRGWSRTAVAASTILLAAVSSAVAALRIVETTAAASKSGQPVVALEVEGRSPSRLDSPGVSDSSAATDATPIAKRFEPAREQRAAAPSRVVRVGAAAADEVVPAREVVIESQATGSPEHSAATTLTATPLAATPISIETVSITHSDAPSDSAGAPPPPADTGSAPPWMAAANAGRAVGQGSRNAGVATAGFFTRLGKRIASSF